MEESNRPLTTAEIKAEVESWGEKPKTIKESFQLKAKAKLKEAQRIYNSKEEDNPKKAFIKQINLWAAHAGYSKYRTKEILEKVNRFSN